MTSPTLKKTRSLAELEDVVPVASGVGAGHPGPVFGIEQTGPRLRGASQEGRRAAGRRPPRARAGTAWRWTSATPARLATSVASETSSASKSRPGPSTKVMTPMTSPLAVSGTDRPVETPDRLVAELVVVERSQLGPAGAEGDSRRCVGVEREDVVRRCLARARGRRRPGFAYVEPDEPALPGDLDRAGVGQPALDQAHGPLDHGRRLETRAQQPGHLGKEREPLASRLRVAQRLAFVFENLGPLQGLCGQPGQRREESQIGFARLGLRDEGEGKHPERAGAADEGLADDRHRLGKFAQDPRHDLDRHVFADARPRRQCLRRPVRPRVKHAPV